MTSTTCAARLADLKELSGGAFADLAAERRAEVANAFREKGGAALTALVRVVLLCYYRDDRVMQSLGQEPRVAVSERPCGGAGRLVAARSGPRAAADLAAGEVTAEGRRPHAVIASEAKQSSCARSAPSKSAAPAANASLSLRASRALACFASLAMTLNFSRRRLTMRSRNDVVNRTGSAAPCSS